MWRFHGNKTITNPLLDADASGSVESRYMTSSNLAGNSNLLLLQQQRQKQKQLLAQRRRLALLEASRLQNSALLAGGGGVTGVNNAGLTQNTPIASQFTSANTGLRTPLRNSQNLVADKTQNNKLLDANYDFDPADYYDT